MKIDLSEVQAQKSALSSSVSRIKEQLSVARSRLSQVVSTDSLKGAVKTAINQKVSNYQIPLLDNYDNALDSIVNRYDGMITLFKETVGETNDSAIINTEYLERIKQRMKDPIEGLAQISARTQSIYADISDIISLTNPSLNDVNTTYANAQKSLDETIGNMGVFNQTVADSGIADLLAAQNQQLFTLKSYSSVPYTSLLSRDYYRSTAFKDDVAEYTQAIHSRGRKVKLQNQLAKQLAESKYSGAVANRKAKPRSEKKKPQTDFEKRLSKMSRAEIEEKYGQIIEAYKNGYLNSPYWAVNKDQVRLKLEKQVIKRYKEVKDEPRTLSKKILADVQPDFKKKIDQMDQKQLEKEFPGLKLNPAYPLLAHGAYFSKTEFANDTYLVARYQELDSQNPVSRHDPNFDQKRFEHIVKTGIDPVTNKEANQDLKDFAKNYVNLAPTIKTGYEFLMVGVGAWSARAYNEYNAPKVNSNVEIPKISTPSASGGTTVYGPQAAPKNWIPELPKIRPVLGPRVAGEGWKPELTSIQSKYSDLYTYEYNSYTNPGPLSELSTTPNRNFYGGRYNKNTLSEDTIFYRAGNADNPLGQWFTREAPQSRAQVRIDTAVKDIWTKPDGSYSGQSAIDKVYKIKIPKGTTIYDGPVGSQGGIYQGGLNKEQIFIDSPWNLDGVEVIDSWPIIH